MNEPLMQEIIDDMTYVLEKYTKMTEKMDMKSGYTVGAVEEILNNAVDDGSFDEFKTTTERRLAMAKFINTRTQKVHDEQSSTQKTKTEELPDIPEMMQNILSLEYVKDNKEVLRNGEHICEAGMAAVGEGKDPRQAMLECVHQWVTPPTTDEEIEEEVVTETTTIEETVKAEPFEWGGGLELNEPFMQEEEDEVEVNHDELMETYNEPAPMFEALIETDALFEEKETLLVDANGIELEELGEI